jgi:hypothetical protein
MALPDLHRFANDLKNRPGPGSNAPPRTIRAKNLDDNYKKVTLIESDQTPKLYDLRYTKDGTRITRILPNGTNKGDLLYWDGERWVVLVAPLSETLNVLTIQSGTLAWTATQDC